MWDIVNRKPCNLECSSCVEIAHHIGGNHLIPVEVWRASPPTNQLQSHKAFSALSISRCIFNINPTQTSNSIFRDFYIPHLCVDS